MSPMDFPYAFTAIIRSFGDDNPLYVHHGLPLPLALTAELKARKLRRLMGTLNGKPFDLAPMGRAGEEEKYLLISRQTLRALKAKAGTSVAVVCQPDETPDEIALPEELLEVFYLEPEAAARFQAMTPGRQRSLAYYVKSAKGVDTRIKRALELAKKLRTHTLYGDLNPEKR
jgi:Bacteriocin-protection, YdeI or OmpD-Associated